MKHAPAVIFKDFPHLDLFVQIHGVEGNSTSVDNLAADI